MASSSFPEAVSGLQPYETVWPILQRGDLDFPHFILPFGVQQRLIGGSSTRFGSSFYIWFPTVN